MITIFTPFRRELPAQEASDEYRYCLVISHAEVENIAVDAPPLGIDIRAKIVIAAGCHSAS